MPEKQDAINSLDHALTLIYNIQGDRWQIAYDVLEQVLTHLKLENQNAYTEEE